MNTETKLPDRQPPLLLIDASADDSIRTRLQALFADAEITPYTTAAALPAIARDRQVVCWLDDRALEELLPSAAEQGWWLAPLPHPGLVHGRYGFGLSDSLDAAAESIRSAAEPTAADLVLCNEEPVLNSVVIARGFAITPDSSIENSWRIRLARTWRLLRHLSVLRLTPMTLLTHKEKRIETAALSVLLFQQRNSSILARRVVDDSSLNDGMVHMLVLAPHSIGELLRFLLASLLVWRPKSLRLPSYIGYIKTAALTISSPKPLEYVRDGVSVSAQEIEIRVQPSALRVFCGRRIDTRLQPEPREVVRTQELPRGEARTELTTRPLPLIAHAGGEEFRELFPTLRENALASESFLMLMVLATVLAALGLFADSAPVIIGAMVLAPLMAPIVSLAMGVLRQDEPLIRSSARTLLLGVVLAIGCAALLTLVMPLHVINSEIGARMRPTLLDLGVAVVSGIAGAYAHARTQVAKSLAGVAIAVALVPPLAVSGVGIGWGEWPVFSGAFLLFLTNLCGIVLAAALTFLLLGYSAFHVARRGLAASLLLVAVISVPLGISFQQMVAEHRIIGSLQGFEYRGTTISNVSVLSSKPLQLALTLVTDKTISSDEILQLKTEVERRLQQPVTLQVSQALLY